MSRTAVFDNIKRTEKLLDGYEEKLQLLSKREAREKIIGQILVDLTDERLRQWMDELQALD